MKKIILLFTILAFVSCKKSEERNTFDKPAVETSVEAAKPTGQEIFESKGNCVACHQPDKKVVGPSLQEIAKIYKEKKGSIVSFLREQSEPIVDPTQYEVMKTNFAITKSMSDEELKAVEEYILTFSN